MDLLHSGGDGDGFEHCTLCGALAAGPCARCGRPTCGSCSVLTKGGASIWAVCLRCDKRGGRSLRAGWGAALTWLMLPILGLLVLVALVEWIAARR
jgi:hypothetical protein